MVSRLKYKARYHKIPIREHRLFDVNFNSTSLDQSPRAKEIRATINKWGLFKLCTGKETVSKTNKQTKNNLWNKVGSGEAHRKYCK